MTTRRELTFTTLDEAVRDAEALLGTGYTKAGNWTLGQVCGHLANWFRYQMDGFPPTPLLMRPAACGVVRTLLADRLMKGMLAGGRMKVGLRTIPQSVPPADADDAAGVAGLRDAVARWQAFPGELRPSPLLGNRTRDEWLSVHLAHCAHHLGFLVPHTTT